ncbi:MAG: hypothetical protein ACFCGT_27160 [Sandaracinaceae bacterium]
MNRSLPGVELPPEPARSGDSMSHPTLLRPGSTKAKLEVASMALVLREEQVRATVQYYGADQETNAELDKITEAVVAELKALRLARTDRVTASEDTEVELIGHLRDLLDRLFSVHRRNFIARKIRDIQRRITQLFFDSEMYAELAAKAGEVKAASWPEQALYFALRRHEEALYGELEKMPVEHESVRQRAIERLQGFGRQLCADFLSRTTPELERFLNIYREVLTEFFVHSFAPNLGEMAWQVIKESRVAQGHELGYQIDAKKFPAFRAAYDKHFLERLVMHTQGKIVRRTSEETGSWRDATLRFVADPRIHSVICEVVNDAVYDYLHGEGFLDLPLDWRRKLARP